MQVTTSITLTVLHDGQFWIGIFEHADEGRYGACRLRQRMPCSPMRTQSVVSARRASSWSEPASARKPSRP